MMAIHRTLKARPADRFDEKRRPDRSIADRDYRSLVPGQRAAPVLRKAHARCEPVAHPASIALQADEPSSTPVALPLLPIPTRCVLLIWFGFQVSGAWYDRPSMKQSEGAGAVKTATQSARHPAVSR